MDASNKKGNGLRESGMLPRPDSLKRRNTKTKQPLEKGQSILFLFGAKLPLIRKSILRLKIHILIKAELFLRS